MSNTIYVMGVAHDSTNPESTGVCIWGVTRSSMYGSTPYKRTYFEQFEVSGHPTAQALEIADASREFYPLALVLEQSPSPVAERIAFCVETHYIIPTFHRQTPAQAAMIAASNGGDNFNDAARHCAIFLRRAREDDAIRDSAWGLPERRTERRTYPAKPGIRGRSRRLY